MVISHLKFKIDSKKRLTSADLNFNEIYHHLIAFYSLNDEQALVDGFSGFEFNCLITFWPVIEIISDFKEESLLWLYLMLTYPWKVLERLILSWNHSNFNLFIKSFFPKREWIPRYYKTFIFKLNSRGTEIFPFSYFENPWLECDLVLKDIKNIHNFHKTRTYVLNFGWESLHKGHHVTS